MLTREGGGRGGREIQGKAAVLWRPFYPPPPRSGLFIIIIIIIESCGWLPPGESRAGVLLAATRLRGAAFASGLTVKLRADFG